MHSLSSTSGRRKSSSESYDEKVERGRLRRSGSYDDEDGSDFSLWSDTGDLVDQLADEEDPLAARLRQSLDEELPSHSRRGRNRQSKRVRYAAGNDNHEKDHRSGGVKRKEEIRIPSPPPKPLGWGQKLLAGVMAPDDGHARMHGLHGKKLIYFLSIFVSLGVFLFGYDQGVMSGEIRTREMRFNLD